MNRGRAARYISSRSQRSAVTSGRQRREDNRDQWQRQRQRPAPAVATEDEKQKFAQKITEAVPKGTCQTMCPSQELQDREAQNRLHHFEMVPGTEKDRRPKGDPRRAVKEYARPAAGKDATNPTDLRPPAVLLKTVHYLIDEIAASPNLHPWTEVYNFVFDRLRSVKQDMIIQRVSGSDCVALLEPVVRFLIYASYRLCGEPVRLFDPRINDTHLQEFLSWLFDCYTAGSGPNPNQEEFQALGLLYNLGSVRAHQHVLELPLQLRTSPSVALAASINQAFLERNPVRLLRLAGGLSFLQTCALHRHLVTCRRTLLLIYSHGFSSRNCHFPLDRLAQLLRLDPPLAAQLCQLCGVQVDLENQVLFSKSAFTEPKQTALDCKRYHSESPENPTSLSGLLLQGQHETSAQ
ncbi:SAC3 domain-containing protein 1 [Oryzias melastigma]|uniref:SAC3 domain-containing protein 1 n=1 Tax=Oryzias melastigma TaxID=30732 RepID=A0A834F9U8_ORYME|nr:SAC3 domain-containing protein 1 [Oryzias melastigma]